MAKKKILSLGQYATAGDLRDKLAAQGITLTPHKSITMPVAYRTPKGRRKVSRCMITQYVPGCGCCSPEVEIIRNRDDKKIMTVLGLV